MKQILPVGDSGLVLPASMAACTDCSQAERGATADMPAMARLSAADTARLAYHIQRLRMILRDRSLGE